MQLESFIVLKVALNCHYIQILKFCNALKLIHMGLLEKYKTGCVFLE